MSEDDWNEFVIECLEGAIDMGDLRMLARMFRKLEHRINACGDPQALAKIEAARRFMSAMETFETRHGQGSCLILESEGMKRMLKLNNLGFYSTEMLRNSENARKFSALETTLAN